MAVLVVAGIIQTDARHQQFSSVAGILARRLLQECYGCVSQLGRPFPATELVIALSRKGTLDTFVLLVAAAGRSATLSDLKELV